MWHTVVDAMLSQQWQSVGQTVCAVPHMVWQWLTMPQTPLLSRDWRGTGMRIGFSLHNERQLQNHLLPDGATTAL